jgi:hypothetical protein
MTVECLAAPRAVVLEARQRPIDPLYFRTRRQGALKLSDVLPSPDHCPQNRGNPI